jgi:hypothetical protein
VLKGSRDRGVVWTCTHPEISMSRMTPRLVGRPRERTASGNAALSSSVRTSWQRTGFACLISLHRYALQDQRLSARACTNTRERLE